MSAETFSIVKRSASVFSTEKKKCGSTPIDATADSALAAITTSSTVADVLDILSACVARGRAVTDSSIGKASSVDNS